MKTIETYEDESAYMFNDMHYDVLLRDGWKIAANSTRILLPYYLSDENDPPVTLTKTKESITLICRIVNQHIFTFHPTKHRHVSTKVRRRAKQNNPHFLDRSKISHRYQYALKKQDGELDLDGVTWADFDRDKHLVLAKDGKIFSAILSDTGDLLFTELADFNANKPNPVR